MMKRKMFLIPCMALAACMIHSSCIGSFGLLNKFSSWNRKATGNKFLNGFLGILLSPVYGICFAVDWVVLNTIEFWSGKQLIAANTTQRIVGSNGEVYLVRAEKNGYTITLENKQDSMQLVFDQDTRIWSYQHENESRKLLRVHEDEKTLTIFTPQGDSVEVPHNEAGIKQLESLLTQIPLKAK